MIKKGGNDTDTLCRKYVLYQSEYVTREIFQKIESFYINKLKKSNNLSVAYHGLWGPALIENGRLNKP